MTKMATDPLFYFVAIFGELAIFEDGHIPEDALKNPYKYEDGHEIAVREREREETPGNEAKMATWHEDGYQKKQGPVGQLRSGQLRRSS